MASPADDIIALYERHAAAWNDARVGPLFERAWLDGFLSLVPAGGDVLVGRFLCKSQTWTRIG